MRSRLDRVLDTYPVLLLCLIGFDAHQVIAADDAWLFRLMHLGFVLLWTWQFATTTPRCIMRSRGWKHVDRFEMRPVPFPTADPFGDALVLAVVRSIDARDEA